MPRFTLTLTEERDPLYTFETPDATPVKLDEPPFEHFKHSFREMPHDKIQQIMAILTKPPRQPRSDKGRPKKRSAEGTPQLPGT